MESELDCSLLSYNYHIYSKGPAPERRLLCYIVPSPDPLIAHSAEKTKKQSNKKIITY